MFLLAVGVSLLTGVQSEWDLILPALLMGAGHCFVFPSAVDLAADQLPPELRGTGTALILAAGDLGMLTGFVALGEVIDRFGFDAALWALVTAIMFAALVFGYFRRETVFRNDRVAVQRT